MSRLNVNQKGSIYKSITENKSATVNKEGGLAFNFEDPAEYLLATIGSAMFVEPKYYADTEKVEDLKKRNFSTEGLDEQAVKIINACFEIADGKNPRDLLALAHWARVELNMRTTPQIMLAVAANSEKTKPFVRKYVPFISKRADEVKQVVGAYEHLFGWKAFPACLKKGVSDRMSTMTEYEILKYNTSGHPSFKDLLSFCERRKDYPFIKEIREYIMSGDVINPEKTPMFAARRELTSIKKWNSEVPYIAKRAGVTWEVLVSQFGNSAHVWETVIPQMGYMALLRNLANFLDANISMESCKLVANKLSNRENVLNSKQLPFRFVSAHRILEPKQTYSLFSIGSSGRNNRNVNDWNIQKKQIFMEAIEQALDVSVENTVKLDGVSYVVADNSGSMSYPVSEKSTVMVCDAANVLCSIIHKRSENSIIGSFGTNVVFPTLTKRNSILTNMEKIATFKENVRGHGTDAWKTIKYLLDNKIKVDRIILLSDMRCYNSYGLESVATLLKKYRMTVNKNAYAHFFDLKGYGTKQTPADKLTNIVAGFSEKILDQILVFEGAGGNSEKVLPSLSYVRENF